MKNEKGFIEGGVIIGLCLGFMALAIAINETHNPRVPQTATQPTGDTVVFKKKTFSYYDLETGKTVELPIGKKPQPKKECQ